MSPTKPYTPANDPNKTNDPRTNRDNEYNSPNSTEGNLNPRTGVPTKPGELIAGQRDKKIPNVPGSQLAKDNVPAKDAVADGQRLSWSPASNARNYVVSRDGQVVHTTADAQSVSYRDPQSNESAKYEVSYTDENGNKQIVEHNRNPLKPKVATLRPNEKGYVLPKGTPSVSFIKDRGEFYLCINKDGKCVYEGPDSLEGMLKTVAAKLTYFAELASMPPIVPLSEPNRYSPTDETHVNRLIGMAKRAGEFHEEAPFSTYKTRQDPQARGFIPEPAAQREVEELSGTPSKTNTEGKASVVK